MVWWCALVVLCVAAIEAVKRNEWRLVNISQGPVRGRMESYGIYAFYNIPYATAPTDEDKFKAPLPPPKWTKPFNAIDKGVICPQAKFERGIIRTKTMQEDCLIANVYVPNTNQDELAVVVFIHGGAFQVGYGNRRKAKELMANKNIIVVTFNYRLGIHGFLCLGTKDAPGNAGMKDMVALLKWVKKNIANFGGCPDNVTISGYSAGAAAADLLILSKSAKGLFNKVIIESGSSVAEYAVQIDPLYNAKTHARTINFLNSDDIGALGKFYKTASYDILNSDNFLTTKDSTFVFTPCVERNSGEDVFLHDSPARILQKGDYMKVPMLYGFTNMEGIMRVPLFESWKTAMNQRFSDFLPPDLTFDSKDEKEKIAKLVKEYYFGDKPVDRSTILGYVNFFTDIMFASPALRSVSLNVKAGNKQIYLYYYSFVDENDEDIPYTTVKGAGHCAQSRAIFDDFERVKSTSKFTNMRKIMRDMWRNFIVTGTPLPEATSSMIWPPTTVRRSPYMSLGEVITVADVLLEDRGRFWDDIYQKFYREPIPPPKIETVNGEQQDGRTLHKRHAMPTRTTNPTPLKVSDTPYPRHSRQVPSHVQAAAVQEYAIPVLGPWPIPQKPRKILVPCPTKSPKRKILAKSGPHKAKSKPHKGKPKPHKPKAKPRPPHGRTTPRQKHRTAHRTTKAPRRAKPTPRNRQRTKLVHPQA